MSNKEKIESWLGSAEGQKRLKESMQTTDRVVVELRESRRLDPTTLGIPFGPKDGSGVWPHQRKGL